MEREGDGDTNSCWCTWNDLLGLEKETGGIRDRRKNRDHPDHSIEQESWRPEETYCHSDFS